MRKVRIKAGDIAAVAVLHETPTAEAIWKALPLEGRGNRWGQEIYFDIPVSLEKEPAAREVVNVGELGYWPTGEAFCIFFGPTPASQGNEIRAASPVNIFGQIEGNAKDFERVPDGSRVTIEKAGETSDAG